MKLQNNIFRITNKQVTDASVVYDISLLVDAEIYKAHFPGKPITPGVCIIKIVEELLCDYLEAEYRLTNAKNIKFLQVIDPLSTPCVSVELKKIVCSDSSVSLQATVFNSEITFTKASIACVKP